VSTGGETEFADAGDNALVAGSAVFGQKNYKAAIDGIRSGGRSSI
jgi:pentose-5-phosphate-3-epimerase